ncbi:MAG: phenylalanine--tRNA ligase subunit beta [Cyclobacteriaceae bacterium]|jgi:phenylalanyl-tRNA synthetase beta chain|nr:phenylalanine--tRNA ligase subunit beta [Cyclobacteriaceae bacterium]
MKISYAWLNEYVAIADTAEETAQLLTSTGLEVEAISPFETVKGGLRGVVIGEVKTCAKHPNADKLSVTTVDVGGDRLLPIVCGASNVAAGQKVVVALPGATLHPAKGEPFTIKATKIRGEVSEGMICAEDELGLGESHAGIIVLTTTLPNGTPAADYFHVLSDQIFEIGLTPNRADAASHIGVARDIRAVKNIALRWPSVDSFHVASNALPFAVSVESPAACPRYSGVTLTGITVKESPAWLKNRLLSIGLTPINNIVDVTNFVLHETGQPLHAFDAASIRGNHVRVKTLPEGTPFVTLDGKPRQLRSTDLVICDEAHQPLCLAGVFGGQDSGVTPTTTALFLESACFAPDSVRKTSLHHQLKTDASFRFERGTDPHMTVYALKRAALLIVEVAGGEVASPIVDVYPEPAADHTLDVTYRNVDRLIGQVLPRDTIFSILERLDIRVTHRGDKSFSVSIPPYRVDVKQQADVVEEILRIYGFNSIPLSETAGTDFVSPFPEKDIDHYRRRIGELLTANGFYELLTNSLTNIAYQQKAGLTFGLDAVEMMNKLSEEQGILRQTMLFTGLEACAHNINRKQKDLKFFEFGKVYGKSGGRYVEEPRLALYMTGHTEAENWQRPAKNVSYHDLAQHVARVIEKSSVPQPALEKLDDPLFEYGMAVRAQKKELGKMGKVKTSLAKQMGLKQDVFYAELSVDLLFRFANPKFEVAEVSKFPEVRRDLSLVLDKQVTFAEIEALVRQTERHLVRDIICFDVYEGDKIAQGKKAYALGFALSDAGKTLTDDEIDKTMARLMAAFEQKMNAVIRK